MFQKFKHKIVAGALLVSGLFVQYQRPATMEDHTVAPAPTVAAASPSPTPNLIMVPGNLPGMSLGPVTNADGSQATQDQISLAVQAFRNANTVIKGDCFKKLVLSTQFTENNGLASDQIYALLASKTIIAGVQFFDGNWKQNYIYKTMGYDTGDGIVYANNHFVKTADVLGSLAIHEAEGHGQGFHHYDVKSTSVPYKMNDFYTACAAVN